MDAYLEKQKAINHKIKSFVYYLSYMIIKIIIMLQL